MKTTKLFFMAALALMTAACSNEDNDLTPQQTAEQPADNMITITAQLAPKSGSALTRAVADNDDNKITVTWAVDETLKIISANGHNATATITAVDGTTGAATISFTIDAAAKGKDCTIIYPASAAVTESAGVYTAQPMTAQTGTLTNDLDVRIGKGTITDEATPQLEVTTQPAAQFAIWKLTLQDNAATPTALSATQVSVKVGGATPVTIASTATLGSATSAVYLAVPGVTTPSTLIIEATTAGGTYKYEKGGVSLALGKYYQSTVKMARTLAGATTSDYGKVVCAAGHLHDAKTAVPAGCTAVGILGKVTATGHGLILALQNATNQDWKTINGWTSVTSYASTTLKVLPDAAARGSLTSYTTLGETAVSNWAVAQKSDYEAIFTNLGSTTSDGFGTTYDDNVNAYITTGVGGTELSSGYFSATEHTEGWNAAWAFTSGYWQSQMQTTSYSVRPVLGF